MLRTFLLEPVGRARVDLRRYTSADGCPLKGYHNASVAVTEIDARIVGDGERRRWEWVDAPAMDQFMGDVRWPTTCACGYAFTDADTRQVFIDALYKRSDTGDLVTLRTAPPGAMWDAWWYPNDFGRGADGLSLIVKCPNGRDWHIDGFASNCDAPCLTCGRTRASHQEAGAACRNFNPRRHQCWVRHGTAPDITVDKNGETCGAGAGSIQAGDYHGFLRGGEFT